ncbi:MAG: NAD-dependent epimerase/dehydratase family protein [Bacteroidales bacterium]|jgi:nucleoside-diphosphate-sugar epimerase|nr:NAD-dependent epimerase/dehydratase family protein [Bacteroidales bacterium]
MSKALITGGAGFMGFHLGKYLLAKDFEIDIVDNFSRGAHDSELENLLKNNSVKLKKVDLMNTNEITNSLHSNYDYIFHLAAIVGVDNVKKQPFDVLQKNIMMLINVIQFAKKQKNLKRFLFTSTSEVYAGTLLYFGMNIPTPESTPITVNDLTKPRTSYMLSKIYGEALCNLSGLPVVIIRPHNIYGPRMGMSHVIPQLLKKAHFLKETEGMEVFSPEHKRTFCYIDDAVQMIYLLVNNTSCIGQTINIGKQDYEITMYDLAGLILKIVGKENVITNMQETDGSPARRCPDMSLFFEMIGYKAKMSLEDGIKGTYNWYRKNIFGSNCE